MTFVNTFLGTQWTEEFHGYAGSIKPNIDYPKVGYAVLFNNHAAVIVDIQGSDLVLAESNYEGHETVSVGRIVSISDPSLRGYYSFEKYYIIALSNEYSVDTQKALWVSYCESKFWRFADNPSSTALGTMQHLNSLWPSRLRYLGLDPSLDILSPHDNALVGMMLVAKDGWRHWEQCL